MSREPQEVELYNGRLDAARVRQFAATLFLPKEVGEYFVCGPGDMIEQVTATLQELGVDSARVHAEHFTVATTAGEAARHGAQAPAAGPAAGEAEVTILMDGRPPRFQHENGRRDGARRGRARRHRAAVLLPCRRVLHMPHQGGWR